MRNKTETQGVSVCWLLKFMTEQLKNPVAMLEKYFSSQKTK